MENRSNIYDAPAKDFPDSVFIGRDDALEQLNKEYQSTVKGQGNFVIINGEAGAGKSALLDHFFSSIPEQDARVVKMQFEQGLNLDPYSSFYRLISDLEKTEQTSTAAKLDLFGYNEQSQLTSDDSDIDFGMRELHEIQSKQSQIQQQILYTLVEHSEHRPLIVALENTHFAPQSSWQFFHYLGDKCQEHKILFVCSLRQDGHVANPEHQPVYADILQRMNRDGFISKINLGRFSEEEIRNLLRELFKRTDFSGNFVSFLQEVSNGVPGQIIKYLKILYDAQILFIKNGVWFNRDDLDGAKLIREGLNIKNIELIQREVNRLTESQQLLLTYASVLQSPFDYRLLVNLGTQPKLTVLRELKKLEDKKFLSTHSETTFHFKSAETKSILAQHLSKSQQEEMHLAIANQISVMDIFSTIERKHLLAYHYGHSSKKYKAYRYLVSTGDLALQNFAFIEARESYLYAMKLEEDEALEAEPKQRIHVLMQTAWLNRVLGYYEESNHNCETALSVHGASREDRTGTLIRMQQGFTYFRLNNWSEAEENFQYCLKRIDIVESFEKSMILYGLGNLNFELSKYRDAQEYYDKSLNFAKEADDKSLIALLYNNLGAVANVTGNTMKAIALYSQAIPLYQQTQDQAGLAKIYNNIGMTYSDENNWDQANQFYGKSLSVTGVLDLAPLKSITFLNRALALAQMDQLKEAREYSFKAFHLLEKLNDALGIGEYHKIQGIIESKDKNWYASEEHFIKALEMFDQFDNKLGYAESLLERGITEFSRNRNSIALKWFLQANDIFTELDVVKKANTARGYINKLTEAELADIE